MDRGAHSGVGGWGYRVAGGALALSGVTGMIGGVLKLTQVDRLVRIFPTALEASRTLLWRAAAALEKAAAFKARAAGY